LISYLINNLNHFLDFFPDFLEETLLTDFVELFEAEMAFWEIVAAFLDAASAYLARAAAFLAAATALALAVFKDEFEVDW